MKVTKNILVQLLGSLCMIVLHVILSARHPSADKQDPKRKSLRITFTTTGLLGGHLKYGSANYLLYRYPDRKSNCF